MTTDETEDHWSHWGLNEGEIAEYTALREDIPAHLETSLWSWVRDAVTVPETGYVSAYPDKDLVRQFERVLQVPIKWPFNRTDVVWAIQQAYLDRPIRDTWRLVNWLLGYGHAHGGTLKTYLLQSGSAYTVEAADRGRCYLAKRVPDGVQHAANAAFAQPNAGRRLAQAWEAAFGVNPDPTKAYSLAVKAVEDAAIPVICPNDSTATLGKVIGLVKSGTWKLSHLREDANSPTHDVLLGMMRTLWTGQHDRHGGPSTVGIPAVTQDEAESAALLAVTLVGWFERDCGNNGVSGTDTLSDARRERCRDDDTGRCGEEEGGRAVRRAEGCGRAGPTGPGTRPVADRTRRVDQTADQDSARNGS